MALKLKIQFPRRRRIPGSTTVPPDSRAWVRVFKTTTSGPPRFVITGRAPSKGKAYSVEILDASGATVTTLTEGRATGLVVARRPTRAARQFALFAFLQINKTSGGPDPFPIDDNKRYTLRVKVAKPAGGGAVWDDRVENVEFHASPDPNPPGASALAPVAAGTAADAAAGTAATVYPPTAVELLAFTAANIAFPSDNTTHCTDGFLTYGVLSDVNTDYPITGAYLEDTSDNTVVPADVPCTDMDGFWFVTFETIPDGNYTLTVVANGSPPVTVSNLDIDSAAC